MSMEILSWAELLVILGICATLVKVVSGFSAVKNQLEHLSKEVEKARESLLRAYTKIDDLSDRISKMEGRLNGMSGDTRSRPPS